MSHTAHVVVASASTGKPWEAAVGLAAHANDMAPPAPVASPDVHAATAENDQFRVIRATRQPGQEDDFHSHPGDRVSLFRTDCMLELSRPDGSSRVAGPKAGKAHARTGELVASHRAENVGDDVCVIDIVEPKQSLAANVGGAGQVRIWLHWRGHHGGPGMPPTEPVTLGFETKGITGRDGYIIAEALVLAMKSIEAMPDATRPQADRNDILKILNTAFPTWEDVFGPG